MVSYGPSGTGTGTGTFTARPAIQGHALVHRSLARSLGVTSCFLEAATAPNVTWTVPVLTGRRFVGFGFVRLGLGPAGVPADRARVPFHKRDKLSQRIDKITPSQNSAIA